MRIPESELILNKDGSIYHLNLLPEDIADTIFVVGDPDRVPQVSCYFDSIEVRKQKRELTTHTGYIGKKRLTVMSTGMGTGGIDIAINELDALANIDFNTRTVKTTHKTLQIIRIGTSGALQKDVPIDSIVVSHRGVGFDGLAGFYDMQFNAEEMRYTQAIIEKFDNIRSIQTCYVAEGNAELIDLLGRDAIVGTTASSGGFYGSQGRVLRGPLKIPDFVEKLQQLNMTNFEMEAGAIYALSKLLGHRACVVNAIIANRINGEYSLQFTETVDKTIRYVLEKVSSVQEELVK
jgi:uridine phosphorylase